MKVIEEREVGEVLSMATCIELMGRTLADLAAGRYIQPPRSVIRLPGDDLFGFMPAYLGEGDYFGAKIISAFHRNAGTEYPSHMGYVMLFESGHGSPVALVDATSITRIRTGAVSAVATRLLAREEAPILALAGAGAQARSHIEAIRLVRTIERVNVYDISAARAQAFAREAEEKYGLPVHVYPSVEEAARDADIICTLTPSAEPILRLEWETRRPHQRRGRFSPGKREVSSDLVAAVETLRRRGWRDEEGVRGIYHPRPGGDHRRASHPGIDRGYNAGNVPGRLNKTDITLFSALGQAVEDVACAKYAYLCP